MTKTIDYFFSIGSPWSYIGLEPFLALATDNGVVIKPYLATVIEENGGIFSRNRPEARRDYWHKDLARWGRARGKKLMLTNRPALADPAPAAMMVIAAYLDGKEWLKLTDALQEAFWVNAKDIGLPDVRRAVADAAGFDGEALLKREQDEDVKEKWSTDRQLAIKSGVFGFPTFIYDGETYWGQDNLHFLESHLRGNKP